MMYKYSIDVVIIKQLYKANSLSFLELKRRIERDLGYSISKDTFNNHIKNLTKWQSLEKKDNNVRGKPVFYSLSLLGRKQYHLYLLSGIRKYWPLYDAILTYSFGFDSKSPPTKEFESDLSVRHSGHSGKDHYAEIETTTQSWEEANDTITSALGGDGGIEPRLLYMMLERREQLLQDDRLSDESKQVLKEIDQNHLALDDNEIRKLEREVKKIDKVEPDSNTDSTVFYYYPIEEREELPKNNNSSLRERPIHSNILPDFPISEILRYQQQQQTTKGDDTLLSNEKINDGIKALLEFSLIKRSSFINGEQRYSIADIRLAEMLLECKKLIINYWCMMTDIWIRGRAPTEDERYWIWRYFGLSKGQKLLGDIALKRHSLKKNGNNSNYLRATRAKVFDQVIRNFEAYADKFVARYKQVIQEYFYLCIELAMFYCPPLDNALAKMFP